MFLYQKIKFIFLNLFYQKKGLLSIKEGIELSLEEHIPLPAPETIFDYELLSENEESLELEVAAYFKKYN